MRIDALHRGVLTSHWMSIFVLLASLQPWRLCMGEACNPGPEEFHVYSANVTGLGNKAPLMDGGGQSVWCIQETHLTQHGQRSFMRNINFRAREAKQPPWKATWGWPCPARAGSISGGITTGTTILATQPIRPMLHFRPHAQVQTSRCAIATTRLGTMWMILASVYGYARSGNHPDHLEDTDWLLYPVAELMLAYTHRPAILAGDMNHNLTDLQSIQPLLQAGWIDLQDWLAKQEGQPPKPTCKGSTRVDFMLLSPGVLPYLKHGLVQEELVPTHSILKATLALPTIQTTMQWPIPRPLPEPDSPLWVPFPANLHPTQAYEQWWHQIEQQWPARNINPASIGRATVTGPIPRQVGQPPTPATRPGDIPTVGWHQSMHTQKAYTQLQRLQALARLIQGKQTAATWQRAHSTWEAILQTDAFSPTFDLWLAKQNVITPEVTQIPDALWLQVVIDLTKQAYWARAQHDKKAARGMHATSRDSPAGVCRALRRAPPLTVDALADETTAIILEVHEDPPCLTVDNLQSWDAEIPLMVGDDVLILGHQEGHDLFVDKVSGDWKGQKIQQLHRDGAPAQTIDKLAKYWAQFWTLPDLEHLADNLPPLPGGQQWPELDLPAITPTRIRQHLKSMSPFAATGPDGVSREDLLHLSDDMLQQLIKVYEEAEATGTWPEALRHGIIRSLAKVDDALSAAHTRPIQVLSITYRIYTSIRTKQILPLLAPRLHPSISGLRGRGPDSIAWLTQQMIEISLLEDSSLMGTILDLTKAFDHLPRIPLWRHALRLGIPPAIIRAWAGAVINHQRHFQIGETVGAGQATTKGFPQGCALSCVAMVLLNDIVGLSLHDADKPYLFTAYADNWQLLATSVPELAQQTTLVAELCERFQLPMDAKKTESWGVRRVDRQEMQHTHQRLVSTTKDLGFIMAYDQKHHTKLQKKRFASMEQDWNALRHCQASLKPKLIGIEIVLWRRYLHAIETSRIAPADYHTLRAKAAKALGFGDAGASSWATINIILPRNVDPGWFALRQTIRTARKWFWHRPYTMDLWHQWLRHADRAAADGPMQTLLQTFNQLSWGLHSDGTAVMENGLTLHWLHVGGKELLFHLHRAWMRVTAAHLSHRQGLDQLTDPDPQETQRHYTAFGPLSTSLLRKAANGTFFSKDISAHWTEDGQCPCCGNQDSAWHRLADCPHTQTLRDTHWSEQAWTSIPRPLAQYGIAEVPTEVRAWQEFLHTQNTMTDPGTTPTPTGTHVEIFTDGAGRLPKDPWLRTGAWAVVQHTGDGFDTVCAGRLAGVLQGSDRAEIYAIWWTCQWAEHHGCSLSIWTHYAPAISHFDKLAQDYEISPDVPHSDLWQGIQQARRQGTLCTIHKVHSHQTRQGCPGEQWAWRGNDAADRQASLALDEWFTEEEEYYMPALIAAETQRSQTRKAQEYIIAVANAFTAAKTRSTEKPPDPKRFKKERGLAHANLHGDRGFKRPREQTPANMAPQTYDYNTGKWAQQIPVHEHLSLTPPQADAWGQAIGFEMARTIWQWLTAIWTPTTSPTWVSWQQLTILFAGSTGQLIRIPATSRSRPCGRPRACGREQPRWGEQACQLRSAMRPMLTIWPWFAKAASLRPSPVIRIFSTCVPVRVEMELLRQVDRVCLTQLPAGAVSTTAYRREVPFEAIQAFTWPKPAPDWPATQSRLM